MHRYGSVSAVYNIDDLIMLLMLNCFRRCVVILQHNLHFDEQITAILKICSQRSDLLKMLRDQGLSKKNMDSVFMLSFYVKFAMRCVHGVVTLLRLTRSKLMPSYARCIVMDM